MKSRRKGAALIMALVVTLVCGFFITSIFGYVMQYGRYSEWERGTYVDHTTLLSEMQIMKGLVIADNLAANGGTGATQHTPALELKFANPAGELLELEDLRFGGTWSARKSVNSGVAGLQRVEVDVYDMFYDIGWIEPNALSEQDFPSHFRMEGTTEARAGGANDSGEDGGAIDDTINPGVYGSGGISPQSYGAYLVRGRLFDSHNRLLRTMEEAFVQILPGA